jgi:hypothetical protein
MWQYIAYMVRYRKAFGNYPLATLEAVMDGGVIEAARSMEA